MNHQWGSGNQGNCHSYRGTETSVLYLSDAVQDNANCFLHDGCFEGRQEESEPNWIGPLNSDMQYHPPQEHSMPFSHISRVSSAAVSKDRTKGTAGNLFIPANHFLRIHGMGPSFVVRCSHKAQCHHIECTILFWGWSKVLCIPSKHCCCLWKQCVAQGTIQKHQGVKWQTHASAVSAAINCKTMAWNVNLTAKSKMIAGAWVIEWGLNWPSPCLAPIKHDSSSWFPVIFTPGITLYVACGSFTSTFVLFALRWQ